MRISDITKVNPAKDTVVIEMLNLEATADGLIEITKSGEEQLAIRFGKVLSTGPDVQLPTSCQGLKPEDIGIFTEFAGHHLSSKDGFYKVVRGYDIIGITTNISDMSEINVTPTANRLMVKELQKAQDEDGIDLVEGGNDPRLADLYFGEIISVGPSMQNKGLSPGMIVAYATYVGEEIRAYESDTRPALKIIVEEDILLTI